MPRPPKTPGKTPNTRLRALRMAREWTQADAADQFADEAGISPVTINHISRWETGESRPHPHYLQKLKEIYAVETEEELGFGPASASPLEQKALPPQDRNRKRMLQRLQSSYEELLTQSMAGVTRIALGLANQPDAVENAVTRLLQTPTLPERPLPPNMSIRQVYEKAGQELLILGVPGAGKSTLLVELARQLVERANNDITHPLPVLLYLSSWAVKRLPLHIWVAEQVAEFYDIPETMAGKWLGEGTLLLLLDGLDEMEEQARPVCIAAINTYQREHLRPPLVVCSRQAEYEAATQTQRLALQQAVVVQPLTQGQIERYLGQAGKKLSALRAALTTNPALVELATTPLMLHVMVLTYQDKPVGQLPTQHDQLVQQLWTEYLARMVHQRKGRARRSSLEQTRAWLQWQARQMRARRQTVFYLEHLQPDWLPRNQRRVYHWLGVRLPAVVLGVLVSLLVAQLMLNNLDILKGPGWLQMITLGGLLGGLLCPKKPEETPGSGQKLRQRWAPALAISMGVGLLLGLNQGWGYDTTFPAWLTDGGIYSALFGLCSFLLLLLLPAFPSRSAPNVRPGAGWRTLFSDLFQTLHPWRSLLVGLLTGVSLGLSTGLSHELTGGPDMVKAGLIFGLAFFFSSLLLGVIFDLKHLQDEVHLTEQISWTWHALRKRLFAPAYLSRMLILTWCMATLIGLVFLLSLVIESLSPFFEAKHWPNVGQLLNSLPGSDVSLGLSFGLSFGLGFGWLLWFLLALFQSITQKQLEDEDRRLPNQGTRRSFLNSLVLGLLIGMMIGGVAMLTFASGFGLDFGLSYKQLSFGLEGGWNIGRGLFWTLFIESSLLFCLITGGLAVCRHYLIRFLLHQAQVFPWRASQFLENAREHILLQRLGGGYSFIHRLFLDYLADAVEITSGHAKLEIAGTAPQNLAQTHHIKRSGPRLQILAGLLMLAIMLSCADGAIYLKQNATLVHNPYPVPEKPATLAFFDPLSQEMGSQWSTKFVHYSGTCQFADGAYHVSQRQPGYFMSCYTTRALRNFTFEVQVTIVQGDCGGIILRDDGYGHFYSFQICQNGTYMVSKYVDYTSADARILQEKTSAAIHSGLHQQNTLAAVADGDTIDLYVNRQKIYQIQDDEYTSGILAFVANSSFYHVTDVAYMNARLWILGE